MALEQKEIFYILLIILNKIIKFTLLKLFELILIVIYIGVFPLKLNQDKDETEQYALF